MRKRTSSIALGLLLVAGLGLSGLAVAAPPAAFEAPYAKLARMSPEERERLREHWQNLPPQEREALRQRLREEHQDRMEERREMRERDGFGQGFEHRRIRPEDAPRGGYRR